MIRPSGMFACYHQDGLLASHASRDETIFMIHINRQQSRTDVRSMTHEERWVQYQQYASSLIHYRDVIMGTVASRITSLAIVYSTVYSDTDKRKHLSSASLAFVRGIHRGPVNYPHKWPVTRKMFPFDDVIMEWPISITFPWFILVDTCFVIATKSMFCIHFFPTFIYHRNNLFYYQI